MPAGMQPGPWDYAREQTDPYAFLPITDHRRFRLRLAALASRFIGRQASRWSSS